MFLLFFPRKSLRGVSTLVRTTSGRGGHRWGVGSGVPMSSNASLYTNITKKEKQQNYMKGDAYRHNCCSLPPRASLIACSLLSTTLFSYLPLSLCFSLCFSVCVSLSLSFSLSLSLSLFLSLCLCLSLYLCACARARVCVRTRAC